MIYKNILKNIIFNGFIHQKFEFRNLSMEECFESPYLFNKYFNNISFNRFVKNITELMEFRILEEELKYLKTFFGQKTINNLYTISHLIKKNILNLLNQ